MKSFSEKKKNTILGKLGCFTVVIFVLQPKRGVVHLVVKGQCLGNVRHSAWLSVSMRSEAVCVIYMCMTHIIILAFFTWIHSLGKAVASILLITSLNKKYLLPG